MSRLEATGGSWRGSSGLVVGVVTAVGLRGIASTLLFGVMPGDPLTYLMAAAAFSAVAFAAVMIPAHL